MERQEYGTGRYLTGVYNLVYLYYLNKGRYCRYMVNKLYKVRVTGWVVQHDFGGEEYQLTPADWSPEDLVREMEGMVVEEQLVDIITEGQPSVYRMPIVSEEEGSKPWVRCMDHLIEELQTDGKHIPHGQRYEYSESTKDCWTCQDEAKAETSDEVSVNV